MRFPLAAGTALMAIMGSTGLTLSAKPAPVSPRQPHQAFCRNAGPLPVLPAEVAPDQGQGFDRGARHYDGPSPPPAPPPPAYAPSAERAASSVSGERASTAAVPRAPSAVSAGEASGDRARMDRRPPPGVSPIRPGPMPRPQSGMLTAGEHDDLLNPELYSVYTGRTNLGQHIRGLPKVDTTRVLTIAVKDRAGQPIPFAEVKITCEDGNSLRFATQADGRAVFFPALDQLSSRLTINVSKGGQALAAPRAALLSDQAGGQTIGVTANRAGKALSEKAKALDLMLVIDTTGSMGDEIRYLQSELRAIISSLTRRHSNLDVRVGFVFYRDEGDHYVTQTVGFEPDLGRASETLARQGAGGGGDYPEAMDQALIRALGTSWRENAVKSLLLVADAPPHDDKFARTWAAAEVARARRIHITPIASSGVGDSAEYAMRAMAALTQSRYIFLTDDSGIGNSHAPPAVDCYLVTRLDALLRRVIDSQLSGQRIEPEKAEVIRRVGDYDHGKCNLPADFRWQ